VQGVTHLSFGLRRIATASYATNRSGVEFRRMLLFETRETVETDKLLVTEEAVRVLDRRE